MRAGIAQYGEAAFAPARSSDWTSYQVGLSLLRQLGIRPSAPHRIQDRTSASSGTVMASAGDPWAIERPQSDQITPGALGKSALQARYSPDAVWLTSDAPIQ